MAARTDDAQTAERSAAAHVPAIPADLKRLVPLAMWVRASEAIEYRVEDILPAQPPAAASEPTASVRLPDEVAGVRYGSGARIRRVRIAPAPKRPDEKDKRILIVSKKALDRLR